MPIGYAGPAIALALTVVMAAGSAGAAAPTPPPKLAPCLACHGSNGTSPTPGVPSLGAQPSKYALIQLFMFREKLRTAEPMNSLMAGWADGDLQTAADFIAALPAPKPPTDRGDPARIAQARALVEQNHCNICHLENFSGQDNVPHIADQREDYLVKTLRAYKSGERHGYDATMAEVLQPIDDAQIVELAYFLSRYR